MITNPQNTQNSEKSEEKPGKDHPSLICPNKGNLNMVSIKCPKCKSEPEIDEYKKDGEERIGVFCSNKECIYHKNPIVGIDYKSSEVFISEALL